MFVIKSNLDGLYYQGDNLCVPVWGASRPAAQWYACPHKAARVIVAGLLQARLEEIV